jgi:hypothetical protein
MAIVYLHRRKDNNEVFYVGIGTSRKRPYQNTGRNKYWHNIVNSIGYCVEITHKNIIKEEACAIEMYLIAFYGRKDLGLGNLCNVTDGGELNTGRIKSKESIERHRLNIKGRKHSEITKLKMSNSRKGCKNAFFGKTHTDISKSKMSLSAKKRPINVNAIESMRLKNIGRKMSDESRIKLSNSRKGIVFSEEHKKKLKIARLKYFGKL